MPRRWHEWLFWGGLFALVLIIVARSDGSLMERLSDNALVIAGVGVVVIVWLARAPKSREAEARRRETVYKSWWVPRSLKMRALTAIVLGMIVLLIASQAGSERQAFQAAGAFLALMAISGWTGNDGNYVELRPGELDVNKVGGAGPAMAQFGSAISYADVDTIRVRKSGDFELKYLDKGKRDNVKKISFKIVPERRREFLDDLRSRVEAARSEGVMVVLDRDL